VVPGHGVQPDILLAVIFIMMPHQAAAPDFQTFLIYFKFIDQYRWKLEAWSSVGGSMKNASACAGIEASSKADQENSMWPSLAALVSR
jgi:hypothetical protein